MAITNENNGMAASWRKWQRRYQRRGRQLAWRRAIRSGEIISVAHGGEISVSSGVGGSGNGGENGSIRLK
jgi:hypothetical protein